ncbi:MAG: CoA transferase [Acetobacteraceae bacterium]|nr:CoA transferase [Acetobacteraceae bacterium]
MLLELGVPVAPVRRIPELVNDPHVWAREMFVKMEDPVAGEVYVPGVAVKMSQTRTGSAQCQNPGIA